MLLLEIFEESAAEPFPGAVRFNDWSSFRSKLAKLANQDISEDDVVRRLGMDPAVYHKMADAAIAGWRISPSRSLLHGLALTKGGPQSGQPIFPSLVWQTRFILLLLHSHLIYVPDRKIVRDETKKPIRVANELALTADDDLINEFVRYMYVYAVLQQRVKIKKLPKKVYRGMRMNDLLRSMRGERPNVKDFDGFEDYHVATVDFIIDYMVRNGLREFYESPILSFTESLSIAQFFTRKEGLILEIDPSKVEVVTSHAHDRRLGGKDQVTNRPEREFILRIPADYRPKRSDITIYDGTYLAAKQNPLSVALLRHDDREATYQMNGHLITARFHWNSAGTGGSIYYSLDDDWPIGRGVFRKKYGFDPLPTAKNLDQLTDFQIKKVKRWW